MQLSTVITSLMVAAASISAAPAEIMRREVGGILICQGVNATGACHYEKYTMGDCHDLPTDLKANASTFAPDGDAFYCYPKVGACSDICTSPEGCTVGKVDFNSSIKYDLASVNWTTLIESFTCHADTTS